ncbi:outer membrane protein assembly factor BamA [Candidatus Binatia bacterium]|nr:outer membrane protein assembly factor BamA [Candidatus Binatia bacterium]
MRLRTTTAGRLAALVAVLSLVLTPALSAAQPLAPRGASSAQTGPVLSAVDIKGNRRVDQGAIRIHIKSESGQRVDPARVDQDLRAIYAMGFFDDVSAELDESGKTAVLTFVVKERPYIASVKVEGGDELKPEEVEAALKVRARTIYDPDKVRRGVEDAKRLYEEKGYLDVKITPELQTAADGDVDLIYNIEQGEPVRVGDIEFEGNNNLSSRELRGVMQTKEKWFLSWLFKSGTLNRDALKTDVERITALYYDNGFVNVKVGEPQVTREGDELRVVIKIDEGEQYNFGEVKFGGDVPPTTEEETKLFDTIEAEKGKVFRASILRDDVTKLTDFLGDQGYAFANVEPETLIRPEEKAVDVTFRMNRGRPVTIGKIEITGNTKTRDKVIRRELKIGEQEQFSATKLRKSRDALRRLGFFSDVNLTTRKATAPDQINVLVDTKEGSTGSFSAGAGYSSGDQFLFNVRVSENNLFGRGQRVVFNADFGSVRRNIYIAFTEPYVLDTPLLGTATIFNTELRFRNFSRGATGFSLRALYPLEDLGLHYIGPVSFEDTRIGLEYRLERGKIFDVSLDAPPSIWTERGDITVSSIAPNFVRNTLNHAFDPTAGSFQDVSVQLAGLGGSTSFYRAEARGRWFFPLYRIPDIGPLVFSTGGTVAYGKGESGLSGNEIPLIERYFPGGINTVRGYETRTLGPRENVLDGQGNIINSEPIGGTNEFVSQNEIIFPILQSLGIRGVVFFDAGNAFLQSDGIDFGNLRYGVGGGVRWLSPFGPLRIEYGIPLNLSSGERKSSILFSFGAPL